MEFYTGRRFGTGDPFVVSIPNGMEFYKDGLGLNVDIREFQFPTGWNSTRGELLVLSGINSFNSQRDGILPISAILYSQRKKQFQFPTGWNSTQRKPNCVF